MTFTSAFLGHLSLCPLPLQPHHPAAPSPAHREGHLQDYSPPGSPLTAHGSRLTEEIQWLREVPVARIGRQAGRGWPWGGDFLFHFGRVEALSHCGRRDGRGCDSF